MIVGVLDGTLRISSSAGKLRRGRRGNRAAEANAQTCESLDHGDVLLAVGFVAHRRGGVGAGDAGLELPEFVAGFGVIGDEIAVFQAMEREAAGGGEETADAIIGAAARAFPCAKRLCKFWDRRRRKPWPACLSMLGTRWLR